MAKGRGKRASPGPLSCHSPELHRHPEAEPAGGEIVRQREQEHDHQPHQGAPGEEANELAAPLEADQLNTAVASPRAAVSPAGVDGDTTWIEMVKLALPVPPTFDALIVAGYVPEAVGVPLMTPLLAFTLKPAGRPVAP